jgi:hypothetical protein
VRVQQSELLATVSLWQTPTDVISERSLKLEEVLRQDCPFVVTASRILDVREYVSEQVADPFGRDSGFMISHGDETSLFSEDAHAFEESLNACWRPKRFEFVAVSLQATKFALCNGVCDPVLMAIDETEELLASRATIAHDVLSGNVREDVDFELVGESEKCSLLRGLCLCKAAKVRRLLLYLETGTQRKSWCRLWE